MTEYALVMYAGFILLSALTFFLTEDISSGLSFFLAIGGVSLILLFPVVPLTVKTAVLVTLTLKLFRCHEHILRLILKLTKQEKRHQ